MYAIKRTTTKFLKYDISLIQLNETTILCSGPEHQLIGLEQFLNEHFFTQKIGNKLLLNPQDQKKLMSLRLIEVPKYNFGNGGVKKTLEYAINCGLTPGGLKMYHIHIVGTSKPISVSHRNNLSHYLPDLNGRNTYLGNVINYKKESELTFKEFDKQSEELNKVQEIRYFVDLNHRISKLGCYEHGQVMTHPTTGVKYVNNSYRIVEGEELKKIREDSDVHNAEYLGMSLSAYQQHIIDFEKPEKFNLLQRVISAALQPHLKFIAELMHDLKLHKNITNNANDDFGI